MNDKVIVTETEVKPDTVIVIPQDAPKTEKKVVMTETTTVTEPKDD
jgi:hypothetical protein